MSKVRMSKTVGEITFPQNYKVWIYEQNGKYAFDDQNDYFDSGYKYNSFDQAVSALKKEVARAESSSYANRARIRKLSRFSEYTSDESTESSGTMEEVSKNIRSAHMSVRMAKKAAEIQLPGGYKAWVVEKGGRYYWEDNEGNEDRGGKSSIDQSVKSWKDWVINFNMAEGASRSEAQSYANKARIRKLSRFQAPEELPEGAGVSEEEENPEVEEQEPPGNTHVNDTDEIPEPATPKKKSEGELSAPMEDYLSEDEAEQLKKELGPDKDEDDYEMDRYGMEEKKMEKVSKQIRGE